MDNLELLRQGEFADRIQNGGQLVCPLCHTEEGIECQDEGWGEEMTYWSINVCDSCSFMWDTVFVVGGYVALLDPEEIAEIKATWGVQLEMALDIETPSKPSRKLSDWH
jgi:hypothetical protein